MRDWRIARDLNITVPNVLGNLLHPEDWGLCGNPAATPSALADWGFLDEQWNTTPLAKAYLNGELSWTEVCILILAKRGSGVSEDDVRPFVVLAKALARMIAMNLDVIGVTKEGFSRLIQTSSYEELTDDFCKDLTSTSLPAGFPKSSYTDIWLNVLVETGLFSKKHKSPIYELVSLDYVKKFIVQVAQNGQLMSCCPLKTMGKGNNSLYFEYMGDVATGLPEIFEHIDQDVLRKVFPFYVNRNVNSTTATHKNDSGLLRVGDVFGNKNGNETYTVVSSLPTIYQIRADKTGKIRSVPKTVVKAWYEFYKINPTVDVRKNDKPTIVPIRDAPTRAIRELINETTIDDSYEHGYDGMLGSIARWLLDNPREEILDEIREERFSVLTIALKLFEEMRYEDEWQKRVDRDQYKHVYEMPDIPAEQLKGMSLEEFKDDFLLRVWSFKNGGVRKYNELEDDERLAYQDFVVRLKSKLESFDAYFPPKPKCPNGMGVGMLTELMMRFWPKSCCSYNEPLIHDALVTLKMAEGKFVWPKTPAIYQDFMGKCATILCKMEEMRLPRRPDRENEEAPDYFTVNEFLWFVREYKDLIKEKLMAAIYKKTEVKKVNQTPISNFADFIAKLNEDVKSAGLTYQKELLKRFVCALLAKPFTVLTGLSGSGKTKLAQAFAEWIGVKETVHIVPVGADWTNNERLLGFPNALDADNYVLPDTGVLKFMIDARDNPNLPFFLILDEMNLSHVERYFADFLSAMESEDEIKLHGDEKRFASNGMSVPSKLKFPPNLFVIGTMNVDETTYMFSPKVLDRAQVIEFRVSKDEIGSFLSKPTNPNMTKLREQGAMFAEAFLKLAATRKERNLADPERNKVTGELTKIFPELEKLGAEFGYRTAIEIVTFVSYYLDASGYPSLNDKDAKPACLAQAIDAAVLQKLLPKLHGALNRLGPVIDAILGQIDDAKTPEADVPVANQDEKVKYPLTCEKLKRMMTRLEKNNFTSFAEA